MSHRTKLTHGVVDVLAALDRALTMYEQVVQEIALKQECLVMESRMALLRGFTERVVDQVQLETLRKAGYGDVRVVRKQARVGGALSGVPAGIAADVSIPERRGSWSRRARPGVARSA